MDRTHFLAQPDVTDFIGWLCRTLPHLKVQLAFAPSRFVPNGLDERVTGIQNVHAKYRWHSAWDDYVTGEVVTSNDWISTKLSLDLLRERLNEALASGCNTTTYLACRAVLQWGGVRGAVPFLSKLKLQGRLVGYLKNCRPLFALNAGQQLSSFNSSSILRFDAGLTKIHSLIDSTGSPIYDSRVGAATAMLYALYRMSARVPAVLAFPTGAARGAQIRDPGALGYQKASQFFSKAVPAHRWARSQVELGWVIEETLVRSPNLFAGSLQERCHQLEAAFFMIGYDLRCLVPAEHAARSSAGRRRTTWVPTSVPFPQVLTEYLACSRFAGHAVSLQTFRQWQIKAKGRRSNTAASYCMPLQQCEFDLVTFGLNELERIAVGDEAGLQALGDGATVFVAGDEYEQVYLTNVYLCGRAVELADKHDLLPEDLLIKAGCAGRKRTAKLILRTGKILGKHFGLLQDARPTAAFTKYFGESVADFEVRLIAALQ